MQKKRILILCLLIQNCTASLVSRPDDNTYVLGYRTGRLTTGMYDSKFIEKAEDICGGDRYQVLEKSAQPKVLKSAGNLVDRFHFYWVISCLTH